MAVNIQKLLGRVTLGEGPHWSAREQALYFVSFFEHTIHKYVPATGLHTKTKLESPVNHIIPVEGTTDQFVVNDKLQLLVIKWDGQENSTVEVVKRLGGLDADNENHTTINDAKADPRGRLYTGTIGNGPGGIPSFDSIPMNQAALYKVDGGKIEKLADDIRLSNGLAFDLKEKAFYYVDTLEYNIRRYDYDVETGYISNKTYIFDFKKNNLEGYPDGMTIDTDGNLWVAVFEGYAVLKIDPRTGALLQKVDIPVRQVTSVTFGGPDFDILYVTTAAMMAVNIQKLLDRVTLGEGPHWSAREQALYFVSFFDETIHKYVPATRLHTKTKLESPVNHIIPVEGTTDQFVVNDKLQLLVIRWDGQENSTVEVVKRLGGLDADNENHTTINDAKADPRGRLYTGTIGNGPGGLPAFHSIPPNQAALYKVDGGKIEKLADDIRLSNGLAFDLKEKAFYYVDTLEYNIRRYDYDVETGNISNKKYIFDLKKNNLEGFPDGMTIDTDGNLWVAAFEGYAVLKIDPRTGTLLQKLVMPVRQVTSVTFGGPDLDILYVTTAAVAMGEGYELQPLSGCLFSVTGLGVTGTPNLEVKL